MRTGTFFKILDSPFKTNMITCYDKMNQNGRFNGAFSMMENPMKALN